MNRCNLWPAYVAAACIQRVRAMNGGLNSGSAMMKTIPADMGTAQANAQHHLPHANCLQIESARGCEAMLPSRARSVVQPSLSPSWPRSLKNRVVLVVSLEVFTCEHCSVERDALQDFLNV